MNVYYVRLRELTNAGRNRFILFETDVPSLKAMTAEINSGRLVHGFRLDTKPMVDDPGTREVISTVEQSIILEDVIFLGHPRWKLVRFEVDDDEAAAE